MSNIEWDFPAEIEEICEQQITFPRIFAHIGGGVTAGLMLSRAYGWSAGSHQAGSGGWFFVDPLEWERETGLNGADQQSAQRKLLHRRLIAVQLMDEPLRLFMRAEREAISQAIEHASTRLLREAARQIGGDEE